MTRHIRLIAGPHLIRYPTGRFQDADGNPTAELHLPRQSGETLTIGANVTEVQARELLDRFAAVDAYGTPQGGAW
jgi:hypothetical protein